MKQVLLNVLLYVGFLLVFIPKANAQDTQFRGFANIDYVASNNNSSFMVGQYDNFVTSQITDRISFLGEVVFEFDEGWILDVERVIIKYEFSSQFNIKVGKIHTPLGYWNNAYHHGTLLQPTIQRPLLVKFEDEGGILPIHTTGLWLSGDNIGNFNLGYDFVIGNGIGPNSAVFDDNGNKAVSLGVHVNPVDYLEAGVSAYFDKLEIGEETLAGDVLVSSLKNQMVVGHVAYMSPTFELISEYHNITNEAGLASTTTNAMFIYAGYNFKKLTPYVKYDNLSYQEDELYYTKDDKAMYTLGLRYNFSYLSNIKVEVSNIKSELSEELNQVTVSYAIGF